MEILLIQYLTYHKLEIFLFYLKLLTDDGREKFNVGNLLPQSVLECKEFKNLMDITVADSKYEMPNRKLLSTKLLYEKSIEVSKT